MRLAYNFIPRSQQRRQKSPSFLAMNPNGHPLIVDSDGPDGKPVTVSQSVACCCTAPRIGQVPAEGSGGPAAFWQALASAAERHDARWSPRSSRCPHKDEHGPAIDVFKSMWKNLQ